MTDVLTWWLALQGIGLIAFPLSFLFLGKLTDRGYALAKVLGLLLVGFLLFIGATIGIVTNDRVGVLAILSLLGVAAIAVSLQRRSEMGRFLQENWRYIVLVEVLFTAAFVTSAYLRSFVPEIIGTEKPTEFAFFNAVLRTDHFPAEDPWLAGNHISYYYLGFIMFGGVTKLLGTAAPVAFNTALIATAALSVVSVFGTIFNLVTAKGSTWRGILFGLTGVVLTMFLSSLEGLLELTAVHGVGPASLYSWAEVEGLALANTASSWYPDEWWWWWRATRVPSGWDIEEFPFFSFLLGDLHPHVMAIPFTLLAIAAIFNLIRGRVPIDLGWLRRNWLHFILIAIVIGGLSFLHSWSLPPVLLLFVVSVFAANLWHRDRSLPKAVKETAVVTMLLLAGSVAFYLPFYLTSHGGLWPPAPVTAILRPDFLPLWSMVTPPKHLLLGWGPLLWLGSGVAIALIGGRWLKRLSWRASAAFLPGLIPLTLWVLFIVGDLGTSGLIDEVSLRASNLLTVALLVALLGLFALAGLRFLLRERREPRREILVIALSAMAIATLMILGVELFYSFDREQGTRGNTVFKLYYQAWIFLAVAIPVGLHFVLPRVSRLSRSHLLPILARPNTVALVMWATVATVLVAAGLVYPLTATFARTDSFSGERTLDGLAFLRQRDRHEFNAIAWLTDNVDGSPVLLEAVGDPYTAAGRISSNTGLPTVVQWPSHEHQWRGSTDPLGSRQSDVETAYRTTDVDTALTILNRYDVEYVYVGNLERRQYGEAGLDKFATFMEVAYRNPQVAIYRIPKMIS